MYFCKYYCTSVDDVVRFIHTGKVNQELLQSDNPGEIFYYSEYGYGILARIVKEVSHKPYADYLKYVNGHGRHI